MANSVTSQIVLDGPRNVAVKFEGILDTSNLASTLVVDPALLSGIDNTGTLKATKLVLEEVQFAVEDGLEVSLFWDATTPVRIGTFTGQNSQKYRKFGGLPNNAGAGVNGKVTAVANGWVALSVKSFTLMLTFTKHQG